MEAAALPFSNIVYEGVPLADCSTLVRGDVLCSMVRRLDEGWLNSSAAFADAIAGEDCKGRLRGQNMASYDWLRDGKRVACKSAQLGWKAGTERWALLYCSIKLDACDELLLTVYTPEGMHLFRHDGRAGLSTNGKATAATGKNIVFVGPVHEPDWRKSLGEILKKMEAKGCTRLAFVKWTR